MKDPSPRPAGGLRATLGSWLSSLVRPSPPEEPVPPGVHERFRVFRRLLERNNEILKLMADMEEKLRGDYLFDRSYILGALETLREALEELVADLAAIGGKRYLPLLERVKEILDAAETSAGRPPAVREDRLVRPFTELRSGDAGSVGAKNAELGEMASRGGLPVPRGFAVTAWAYRRFVEEAGLEERIAGLLGKLNLKSFAELARVSDRIQEMVLASPVPEDVVEAITAGVADLVRQTGATTVAVRSSAVGEDGSLSFAGQYRSELNVPIDDALDAYRRVLAGKFTPGAIYYLLSHSLRETDNPMGVGFVEMIDAVAAGVVYTRDPVDASREVLVIQAVRGLGSTLVSGAVSPDIFTVSRRDGTLLDARIATKTMEMVPGRDGGVEEHEIPQAERKRPSLTPEQVERLARLALEAEGLYGGPRDIEWAVDRSGRLVMLQCRPLRVFQSGSPVERVVPEGTRVLVAGGLTASPGAGSGRVFQIGSAGQMEEVPDGAVVVAERPLPGLVAVMDRVTAIVCRVGGSACHMATLARERGVPALVGVEDVALLEPGRLVTVDATAGTVFDGAVEGLVEARRSEHRSLAGEPIFEMLRAVLRRVTPLHLIHPADPDFTIESCATVHDVTRFAHQKGMEEMFRSAWSGDARKIGVRLRSSLPLPVTVVHLERDLEEVAQRGHVQLGEVGCPPFQAFWAGMEAEGWPRPPAADGRGFLSVMATHMARSPDAEFLEDSFAVVTGDYMILSLRMGYHFTTVEALWTGDPSRNTIRMQYKEGGAALDRRVRRISLIDGLLRRLGFESRSAGDFLDASLTWVAPERALKILNTLGRLNIRTKQLDMALANDRIAAWYEKDLAERLGFPGENDR